MNEQEALKLMVAPGTRRSGKFRDGVIQILITRACDKSCFACTQGSNLGGKTSFMSPEQFEQAVLSLKGYFGVYGVFGGNPATSPHFAAYCEILRRLVPFNQRGIWCNNPITPENAVEMRQTFDPSISNLNVHLDVHAYQLFKAWWPESNPVGLEKDSRHSPVHLAMKDVLECDCPTCLGNGYFGSAQEPDTQNTCGTCNGNGTVYDEARAWELISRCDINQHWSAMIGVFRGELRAWFCEVAGAQAMIHQDEPDYPDTGINPNFMYEDGWKLWWQLPMEAFTRQVRQHCHNCAVPLKGYGQLAQADDTHVEQTSETHRAVFKPKRRGRAVELVTALEQMQQGRIDKVTHYLQNSSR